MYYEINVSLNGKHFFATAERSLTSTFDLKKVLKVIVDKFPESEGYNVSVTRHENVGYGEDVDEILNQ